MLGQLRIPHVVGVGLVAASVCWDWVARIGQGDSDEVIMFSQHSGVWGNSTTYWNTGSGEPGMIDVYD